MRHSSKSARRHELLLSQHLIQRESSQAATVLPSLLECFMNAQAADALDDGERRAMTRYRRWVRALHSALNGRGQFYS